MTTVARSGVGAGLLVLALAGCGDPPLAPQGTGPGEPAVPDAGAAIEWGPWTDGATAALRDAATRSLPALEAGGPTGSIRDGIERVRAELTARDAAGLADALGEARRALGRYAGAAPDAFAPDVESIRLVLDAIAGFRTPHSTVRSES